MRKVICVDLTRLRNASCHSVSRSHCELQTSFTHVHHYHGFIKFIRSEHAVQANIINTWTLESRRVSSVAFRQRESCRLTATIQTLPVVGATRCLASSTSKCHDSSCPIEYDVVERCLRTESPDVVPSPRKEYFENRTSTRIDGSLGKRRGPPRGSVPLSRREIVPCQGHAPRIQPRWFRAVEMD